MTGLFKRLKELDADGQAYELDFITMRNGFVYRNAKVLLHDEDTMFIRQQEREGETYLKTDEIASARIIYL